MSNPEIARRCHVCGASIREAAAFCPQCGENLTLQTLEEKQTTSVVTTPLVDLATDRDEVNPKGRGAQSDKGKPEPGAGPAPPPQKTLAARAPAGRVRDKIQRATTLARDVEGDVKHRVQKVRQMSSVVLDEAAYDPSLRFVLVAAALFLLFLLVLLLNKLIG
jgi:predicted  nucleic acid-binding Zn-ribbon protein